MKISGLQIMVISPNFSRNYGDIIREIIDARTIQNI